MVLYDGLIDNQWPPVDDQQPEKPETVRHSLGVDTIVTTHQGPATV